MYASLRCAKSHFRDNMRQLLLATLRLFFRTSYPHVGYIFSLPRRKNGHLSLVSAVQLLETAVSSSDATPTYITLGFDKMWPPFFRFWSDPVFEASSLDAHCYFVLADTCSPGEASRFALLVQFSQLARG